MTYTLKRIEYREDGIFSELRDDKGVVVAHTLEHSYDKFPKLYKGTFNCVRGMHQLHDAKPFETFEITGVKGHINILFHAGNWNKDSEGCVLLGSGIVQSDKGQMITGSKVCFKEFMVNLAGANSFLLVVE